MIEICYWPDGTWCYRHELEQMSHMSDDFSRAILPENSDEELIEQYIERALKKQFDQSTAS